MSLSNIQIALYELWFNYYTKDLTAVQRSNYVQSFIDNNLQGYDISKVTAKHPAHYKRESDVKHRQYPIVEILGDFIIRAEEDDEKLTSSAQTQVNRENKRNEYEVFTDFTDSYDDEEDAANKMAGLYSESDIYKERSDELYVDFTEIIDEEMTTEEFESLITYVKSNAKEYAKTYARRFNKDYRTTLRQIKGLDVDRVSICNECGDVYYKHDLRRKYCDLRPSCEANAKRRRESERYYEERSKKVKDKAERLHYIVEGKKTYSEVLACDTSVIF